MTKLIGDFEQRLQDADKSKQTLRAYLGTVERFDVWFEKTNRISLTVESLTPTDLRLYRDYLVQTKLKPSSINANLAALRTLGAFISEKTNCVDRVGFLPVQCADRHTVRDFDSHLPFLRR